MPIEYRMATTGDIPALRDLWKEAFGDGDRFLDTFFSVAFSGRRCRVLAEGERVYSVLYLFDCTCGPNRMAYIYAVATAQSHQGQGLASRLMEAVHGELQDQGYGAAILVPGTRELVKFYARLGYKPCAPQGRIKATAQGPATLLSAVSPRRYGELRRELLPSGSVIQEGVSLEFLATQAKLYSGKNLLLAATTLEDGTLLAQELLCKDPVAMAPKVLKALKAQEGIFRVPYAEGRPFALYYPLQDWQGQIPGYFAFAYD